MKRRAITTILALTVATVASLSVHSRQVKALGIPQVTLLRTPHEGIQPQTVLGRDGVLHMIYFQGRCRDGRYRIRAPRGRREGLLSTDSRNSEPESAVAIGAVRGPQIAVGRNGRVYVIWFGSRARSGDSSETMPVFFHA
jgi:hypothetical protein